MNKRGKKLSVLLTLLAVIGLSFFIGIPKAYAAGEHEFTFKFYTCDLDEEALWDQYNPETFKVTTQAEIVCNDELTEIAAGSKVEVGSYVVAAVHYKPGTPVDYAMQFKFNYDTDSFEPTVFHKWSKSKKEYSTEFAYEIGEDLLSDYNWDSGASNPTAGRITATLMDEDGSAGDPLTDEMDLMLFYFKVLDDGEKNTDILFEFDRTYGTGIAMANKSAYVATDGVLQVKGFESPDNTLGTLTVKNGSTNYALTPTFTPGDKTNKTYTTYVPSNITSVDIAATPNEEHAIVSGTGTKTNLQYGNNSYSINVLSQSGDPETYTVNVYRINSENTLSALALSNVDFGAFSSNTTSYTATVPYTTDKTNVTATATAGNKATVTGTGNNKPLNVGSNTVSVTVSPESCKSQYSGVPGNTCTEKTYTVTVTREPASTISTLNDLLVDGNRVPGFTPGDPSKTYTLADVGYTTSNIIISYVKGEDHETVTGDGTKTLNVGNNSFDVVVTAQDGTTQTTYTINVYKKSNNANLSALNVTSSKTGSLDPGFASNKTSYTYHTDPDETSVNISYTKAHENASVTTTPASLTGINPRETSSVTIEVTPEDTTQTKKTYTITFDVAKSTNGNLSEITIDTEPIDQFDPDVKEYNITVSSDTESVIVGAQTEDDRSNITSGIGAQALDYGENTVEITVQPEDPNAEPVTYTLKITRAYKTNADLADLTADTITVPEFQTGDPDGKEYNLGSVASTKSSIDLVATPADTDATVTGDGTKTLAVGDNTFPIVVTAQDGTTTKTYYVKVRRLNDAKNLETLTITSDPAGTWDKAFNPTETTYTYTTDPDETEVIISATVPEGSGSTITSGPGTYNPTTTSEVTIIVKAEDNSEKRYIVNLVRAESGNNYLSDLTIDGDTIDGFRPETTEYNVSVPSETDKVTIGATLEDDRADYTGDGEKTLAYGPNQVLVTVTAENGDPKVYTINITREYKTNANFADLTADGVTVPHFNSNDPDGTDYDLGKVNNDKASIILDATAADPDATVSGIGTKALAIGDNSFDVTVTAQDGTTQKTYTVKVRRKNNDSSLTGLEVVADTQGTLSPEFDPTKTEYTYTSDPDEDEVTVTFTTPDGATAVIVGHPDGKFNPQDGDEDAEILVTAEDGTVGTYVVHVVRGRATNADLDELSVLDHDLDPDFDPAEDHYEVNVASEVDSVIITAHAADAPRATVSGTGEKTLAFGSNVFEITVTADDTSVTKPYYVTVIRELSNNVKLDDLKVNDVTITDFDPDTPAYNYGTVGNDVTSIDVVGIPKDENATAETSENANNLVVGENTITVTVTAQNGAKGYYTVTVTREASSNNYLDSLEVVDYDLDPGFDKDTENYSITVPSNVDSVTVNAVAEDEDNATVTIEGNENLQPGENTITVTVEAENGETKTYTITVIKEEEQPELEKITSQIHIIEDGMIKTVAYKSLPDRLKDECDNDNWKLHIFDKDDQGEIADDQQLGTGMIIKLIKNDILNDSDLIVVKGDVNGDSQVLVTDVILAVAHFMDASQLDGVWLEAADVNSDGVILVTDVILIVNKYLNE